MLNAMADGAASRERLIQAGTRLIQRQGFVSTRVEEICEAAGLTKGAFFHHFESKEDLARACLQAWDQSVISMLETGPFQAIEDPIDRALGCMSFVAERIGAPGGLKSCLAGTTVQEVHETYPGLRDAAQACFEHGATRLARLLDDACATAGRTLDTRALATMWLATMQGSLLLCKASGDETVIRDSLAHVERYIESLLRAPKAEAGRARE